MERLVLEVNNCIDCPFANCDNERGYDGCNLAYKLDLPFETPSFFNQLPSDKRHKDCPLNKDFFKIIIVNNLNKQNNETKTRST